MHHIYGIKQFDFGVLHYVMYNYKLTWDHLTEFHGKLSSDLKLFPSQFTSCLVSIGSTFFLTLLQEISICHEEFMSFHISEEGKASSVHK